jgi:hypothetical protein
MLWGLRCAAPLNRCPASGLFIVKTVAHRQILNREGLRNCQLPRPCRAPIMAATMHTSRYTYPLSVLIICLGLLPSQVCGVICSISNCSASAPVKRAAKVEQTSHCHQHRSSSRQDQPSNDSHKCPAHDSVNSILTPDTVSTAVSPDILHPAVAELIPSFDVLFELAGIRADRSGHFRSPPHRPHFTVLRV